MVEDSNHTAHQQPQNNNSSSLVVSQLTDQAALDESGLVESSSSILPGRPTNQSSTSTKSSNNHQQEPLAPLFPLKGINSLLIMSREKFNWDQSEQGQIQGAFFFGYILFQIPGARMAESVGAHWIIMVATFGSALISLAFPLSTQLNSIYLLMLLRFVMGLCQSAFFPASYVLFCRWLPEGERSVLLPVMFIGSNIGSISTYIMSAYLIRFNYGWPSVFYLSGLICLLVGGFWAIFGSSGPEDNWLITKEEKRYILQNVNNQSSESNSLDERLSQDDDLIIGKENDSLTIIDVNNNVNLNGKLQLQEEIGFRSSLAEMTKPTTIVAPCCAKQSTQQVHEALPVVASAEPVFKKQQQQKLLIGLNPIDNNNNNNKMISPNLTPVPCWSKLLKSIPVWTLILSMYGNEWSNVVLCYELPTYLNTALEYPIERNGVINSFFQFTYAVASPIMSSLGAQMLARRTFGMHKIHVRKLFQSLATFGQLACFLGIAICGLNVDLIILLMFASIVFRSCANAGDIMVAGDLSPEYAGTIFAFANSVGNTAGFVVPFLAGQFITNAHDHDQWTPFWLTTACIMGASGLIFLIFGETRRQDFSLDTPEPASTTNCCHPHLIGSTCVELRDNNSAGGGALWTGSAKALRIRSDSCNSESARRRRTSSCCRIESS